MHKIVCNNYYITVGQGLTRNNAILIFTNEDEMKKAEKTVRSMLCGAEESGGKTIRRFSSGGKTLTLAVFSEDKNDALKHAGVQYDYIVFFDYLNLRSFSIEYMLTRVRGFTDNKEPKVVFCKIDENHNDKEELLEFIYGGVECW